MFNFKLKATRECRILIGTHHKVLTVYMIKIFQEFAKKTKRTISVGMADDVDYRADIILDHHSRFDFSKIKFPYHGLHIRRDPRDIIISSGFYHKHSKEEWLHIPHKKFSGKSYQQHINSLETLENVFLFELRNEAGATIRDMLNWDYNSQFVEFKYEELVSANSSMAFREGIENWQLSDSEKRLLQKLFNRHSVFTKRSVFSLFSKATDHVRDPNSGQYSKYFTEKLSAEFFELFPDALEALEYT